MTDVFDKISHQIETQFPSIYRTDGQELITFIKAYYEFLEESPKYSLYLSRKMFELRDIDESLDDFVKYFKNKYLDDFPFISATDNRFLIKHIMDYYRTKGSKLALELLMRMMFKEEVEIYYPGDDVLRVSDSKWWVPRYIEVSKSSRTKSFLGKQIIGSRSGAKAFVEGIVQKRVDGKIIDVLYMSELKGTFVTGELVSDDGVLRGAPKVTGSLSTIDIEIGGRNNAVGDIFDVVTDQGRQGKVRVVETEDATGRVDFNILDGGFGYTTDEFTDVYVSDAVLSVDNSNNTLDFVKYEPVIQRIETIRALSAATFNVGSVGDTITGKTAAGVTVANGVIISIANTDGNYNITGLPSSNSIIKVQLVDNTSFDTQYRIYLNPYRAFAVGEVVEEESEYTVTVGTVTGGPFTVGETVEQKTFNEYGTERTGETSTLSTGNTTILVANTSGLVPRQTITKTGGTGAFANNTVIRSIANSTAIVLNFAPTASGSATFNIGKYLAVNSYGFGVLSSTNGSIYTVTDAWGDFESGATRTIVGKTSGASAIVNNVAAETSALGASAFVTAVDAGTSSIIVNEINDRSSGTRVFNDGNKIRGAKTRLISTVNTAINSGATLIYLNGNNAANGVIDSAEKTFVEGIIVGSNTTTVGVFGNTGPFFTDGSNNFFLETARFRFPPELVPQYPNNQVIELKKPITEISAGVDADFDIGFIENTEVVNLNIDKLDDLNIAGIPLYKVYLSGKNSGVGFVDNITVNSGGTGYSNGAVVTFEGGGFLGGDPFIPAEGLATTTSAGAVDFITLTSLGEGYYDTPTITIPGGTGANTTVNMDFGFGFFKLPNADADNILQDVLSFEIMEIGRVASLTRINPGRNYRVDPFVSVVNKYITSYNRRDYFVTLNNVSGAFILGETVTQIVGPTETGKGRILEIEQVGTGSVSLKIQRESFNVAFLEGIPLTGDTSSASGDIVYIQQDETAEPLGDNADISGTVIAANGIATKVEVVDSGYGYTEGGSVSLERDGFPFVITGKSRLGRYGIGEGYWKTTNSHLNSEKKIQDNRYYQEYSYDILSGVSLNRYERIVRSVLHVAGNELFGSVVKTSNATIGLTAVNSTITVS